MASPTLFCVQLPCSCFDVASAAAGDSSTDVAVCNVRAGSDEDSVTTGSPAYDPLFATDVTRT